MQAILVESKRIKRDRGRIMHLFADVSVPEHTRNNAHCTEWHYESEQNSQGLGMTASE